MITTPIIIALTGLAGAGKDTVADTLVTHAGFTKIAFADALRSEVAEAFGLGDRYGILSDRAGKEQPHNLLALVRCGYGDLAASEFVQCMAGAAATLDDPDLDYTALVDAPRSPRQIMQLWGTEYRRAQDPDYWTTQARARIGQLMVAGEREGYTRIVITDCRFDNEAATVRALGGTLWQVVRPGLQSVEGGHASQTDGARLQPDVTLLNGSTVVGLMHTTLRALQSQHGGAILPDDLFGEVKP